jgi:acyl-CoA reductase-like NAD-dependent aldehyde dehydrogenase
MRWNSPESHDHKREGEPMTTALNSTPFRRSLCKAATLRVWDVPGARSALAPFGGIKNSGLGDKEGLLESMRACTHLKTLTIPWGIP